MVVLGFVFFGGGGGRRSVGWLLLRLFLLLFVCLFLSRDRLKKGGVMKRNGQLRALTAQERYLFSQTNTGTLLRGLLIDKEGAHVSLSERYDAVSRENCKVKSQ